MMLGEKPNSSFFKGEHMENDKEEILMRIKELWKKYPQQRLGQLLENYVFFNGKRGDQTSVALFFQEDSKKFKRTLFSRTSF